MNPVPAPSWTTRWQAWVLQAVLTAPPGAVRAWLGLGLAALLGAGVQLMQGLGLQEELAAQRRQLAGLQARWQTLEATLAERQAGAADSTAPSLPVGHWPQQAQALGLQLGHFKWAEGEGGRFGKLQLRVQGTYAQHVRFLDTLARQGPRLLAYQLQAGAQGRHGAELVLAGAPGPKRAVSERLAGLEPLESRPDPLSPPPPPDPLAGLPEPWRTPSRQAGVLQAAPLADFDLVGTLEREGRWLALLRWQGRVHTVGEGEALGAERAQVHRIAEAGVWLREPVRDGAGRWTVQERPWRVGGRP